MAPILKVCFLNTAVLIEVLCNGPKVTRRISVGSLHKFWPLHAARLIVSMILVAERWDLSYRLKSVRRKAVWKMESYPLIRSMNLSPFLSPDLDRPIYSVWDCGSFYRRRGIGWERFVIYRFAGVTSVIRNYIYRRINFTYGNNISVSGHSLKQLW
jgi:hypothetical protein